MKNAIIIGFVIVVVISGAIVIFPRANASANTTSQATTCIITLFGQQYNVTKFRNMHKGGDVFVCGTDMTQAYQQQHGSDISRIKQYLK